MMFEEGPREGPKGPTGRLRVSILGCGTSAGVPVPGCECTVCTSSEPKNERMRPCLRVETFPSERDGAEESRPRSLVVDTPPDFRMQCLRFGVRRVDAVLYTHAHADHIFGLDDLRAFNFRQSGENGGEIPCFGSEQTLARLRRTFGYVFDGRKSEGGGKPRLRLHAIDGPFEAAGVPVIPVPVFHGSLPVLGFRIGDFAYVTDVSSIPEASYEILAGVRRLVLGALRYRPHRTHFSVGEAIAAAERIGAEQTYFTHMNHDIDYVRPEVDLPAGVELAYDGLAFEL